MVGPPEVILIGDQFELLRAITGRRSVDQLRQLRWKAKFETVLPAFAWNTLRPAASPIYE